jgi:hypothetical protein
MTRKINRAFAACGGPAPIQGDGAIATSTGARRRRAISRVAWLGAALMVGACSGSVDPVISKRATPGAAAAKRRCLGVVAMVALAACSGSTNPNDEGVPESSLHFLTPDPGAPGFLSDTVRFYAVVGQERRASLYYRDSVPLATLDVPAKALTQAPDGTPLQDGDSLLITIAIADSSRLMVGFEPSGLTFHNGHPAVLTLSYAHADSALSPANAAKLAIWGQEHPDQSWHRVTSQISSDSLTVTGSISGFTVYATAY